MFVGIEKPMHAATQRRPGGHAEKQQRQPDPPGAILRRTAQQQYSENKCYDGDCIIAESNVRFEYFPDPFLERFRFKQNRIKPETPV